MIDIGARIKHLRQINGLAQSDLAERAGLTKGAISQVERNLSSPSVANLFEILSALNETPSSFFADVDEEKVLFRKTDALPSEVTGYKTFDTLLPKSRYRSIVAYRATISPGRQTPPEPAQEGENYVLVLSGRLGLQHGKVSYVARKGESLYFSGEQEFSYSNKGKTLVDFLWVRTSG
ncbi:MAG: helix-turn-helix domain-containing protein [Deltaproteobacteria bacterium]|nr:helix-turn-helix domain-containing protein [Deltaproteobacteria bacterium]